MGDDDQVFRAGHLHVPLHLFFFLFGGGGLGFRASCAPPFRAVVFFFKLGSCSLSGRCMGFIEASCSPFSGLGFMVS